MAWLFGKGRNGGRGGKPPEGPPPPEPPSGDDHPFSGDVDVGALGPEGALELLKAGNRAFLSGQGVISHVTAADLAGLREAQHPFAAVIACADSRTPPTILFNQGLGRLFIVRVAGNTIDRRGLASIVYAVKHLKCPLVLVLGHTGCGAVAAAEAVVDGKMELDPSLEEMVTPIIPAVLHVRARGGHADAAIAAVEENARRVAERLRTAETALAEAMAEGRLKIVAAVKHIDTGEVKFLD
ncbi:carbonic anhydrase [Caulobacter sp. 17J80-11]|uniref:carbonic anhydrase n=1 Tax=Caulobacter sp. 17J80-11 TaxID=2763502 RepID=UPI001653C53B|nr:carbonic anhydrase [Caulobacter sp. 17J80-11]MBC6981205.1 carbonic anhydrase [Caulobacter sp. 17J80-11]